MESNYYAVIPAEVRYCEKLSSDMKLLYAEISALANKEGYCWATNAYFASLFKVSARSIINWLNTLIEKGFIAKELVYEGKEVKMRRLYLVKPVSLTSEASFIRGSEASFTDNIYNNEYYNINKKENIKRKSFEKPTLEEIEEYCKERNNNINAKAFYDYFEAGNWVDAKGNPVKNWKQKVITWERYNNKKEKVVEEWTGPTTAIEL